jgi:hypothetical protein
MGQSMGFSNDDNGGNVEPLSNCAFRALVEDTLQLILRLLTDSSQLSRKCGCQFVPSGVPSLWLVEHNRPSPVDSLNAAFLLSKAEGGLGEMGHKVKNMTRCAIRDRKQFKFLISDAKDLIDSLQEITKNNCEQTTAGSSCDVSHSSDQRSGNLKSDQRGIRGGPSQLLGRSFLQDRCDINGSNTVQRHCRLEQLN